MNYKEILRRKETNKDYAATIQADGTYGTELQQASLFVEEDPIYDSPVKGTGSGPSESYKYDILVFDNIKIQ